jgi:hypothetical protein
MFFLWDSVIAIFCDTLTYKNDQMQLSGDLLFTRYIRRLLQLSNTDGTLDRESFLAGLADSARLNMLKCKGRISLGSFTNWDNFLLILNILRELEIDI